ncbi:MAG: threonylcarbamoyl-AMP synthase [Rikenellaceae bacterium]|nr:threonylcarbamoyl-AMP synthase [Rikenellaceae bacterium]
MEDKQLFEALDILKKGGIILYPTDTVWGLGCDATNASAVEKIFRIKERADSKSMIILLDHADNVSRYVKKVPSVAWELLEVADKPLTLILPDAVGLAENLVAEDGTIAVRLVGNAFCRKLIRKLNRPLVSTSANISGQPAPLDFKSIPEEIINAVDLVVDPKFEENATGRPSSIISVGMGGEIKIIRE